MSASETDTVKLDCLARYIKKSMRNSSSYLSFGTLLQDVGEYDQAERFYESLLNELPSKHQDIAAIYASLGSTIVKTQKNLQLAFYYLRQSLALQMKVFPENLLLPETLASIAAILVEHQQYQLGLDCYQLILTIYNSVEPKKHSIVLLRHARVYNNIGYIYSKLRKFSFALKCYKVSHKIEKTLLPSNHPTIATGLNNIAAIYLMKQNFQLADKYFQQANEIRQTSLPFEHHPELIQMYNNIGVAQYERKNFDQALILFHKTWEIQLKCLPPVHTQTAILYNSLEHTYLGKNNYYEALQMYKKALEIGQQCWPSTHPEISQAHGNIGNICRLLKDYTRALNSCEKALEIAHSSLPLDHPDLAEAYKNLAQVYSDTDDHSMSLANFLKALDIYTKKSPMNPFQLGVLYEKIGVKYNEVDQYQEALNYLQKTLNIFQLFHEDESLLTILFFSLGRAYYQNSDYDNVLQYMEKCLHYELLSIPKVSNSSLSQTYDALGDAYKKKGLSKCTEKTMNKH
ncbi:unnamed protein product [Rotaria sp. Silwood2]|nr:unnamed protein product [Rotaria sp. Silwood2]